MNLSFTQVKETCIYVTDLDIARNFYQGKLGLKMFSYVPNRHIFFKAGSSVFLCFIAEATKNDTSLPPHYGSGTTHFAFECEQEMYTAWKQKIVAVGIAIEQEVRWPNGGQSFYFRDPDNHLVEIVEQGMWDFADEMK